MVRNFFFKVSVLLCGALMLGAATKAMAADGATAVIYYSRTGNTEQAAKYVAELTQAELFKIEPAPAYPDEYHATVDEVKKEIASGNLHDFKAIDVDLSKYDTVILAAPTWWGHIPSPFEKWLDSESSAFEGKNVITFNTHGGSGVAQTRADFERLLTKAKFGTHLSVSGAPSKEAVENWLKENNLL